MTDSFPPTWIEVDRELAVRARLTAVRDAIEVDDIRLAEDLLEQLEVDLDAALLAAAHSCVTEEGSRKGGPP